MKLKNRTLFETLRAVVMKMHPAVYGEIAILFIWARPQWVEVVTLTGGNCRGGMTPPSPKVTDRPLSDCSLSPLHPYTDVDSLSLSLSLSVHFVFHTYCVTQPSPVLLSHLSLPWRLCLSVSYKTLAVEQLPEPRIYECLAAVAGHRRSILIRISTDILWRVFQILTKPVPYTFVSVNRRNKKRGPTLQCCPAHFVIPSIHGYGTGFVKMWKARSSQNIR